MRNIPDGLLYSKDDEWIRIDGDEATIGLTDYEGWNESYVSS